MLVHVCICNTYVNVRCVVSKCVSNATVNGNPHDVNKFHDSFLCNGLWRGHFIVTFTGSKYFHLEKLNLDYHKVLHIPL